MSIRRVVTNVLVVTSILAGLSSSAYADFGSLQRLLFRGSEYAGNNLFLSNPQGGPLFDFNVFRQRLEYNRAGQGYTYEFYRFFGPDSYGNENTLDLGPFKIQLGVDPALVTTGQPIGIHGRTGFTTRFIPEAFFETQTGQRSFNQFSGIGTFAPAPLNYTVSLNTGIQDFEWTGNAFINSRGRINAMGFYDFELRFTNIGNYEADGVALTDEQVTDLDIGPINVSGNIFTDGLAGLLQSAGATTDAVVPRILSGAAAKDKRVEELIARLEAGEKLDEEEMELILRGMIESAIAADPIGVMTNGLPSEIRGFENLALTFAAPDEETINVDGAATAAPEPGTLGLLAAGLLAMAGARSLTKRYT